MTASPLIVLERAVEVHRLFEAAGVPHAIGGALALAYHVGEARTTRAIDLNVSGDPQNAAALFGLLPPDMPWSASDVETVRTTGQVRLWWPLPSGQPPIPLDLFFPQSPLHLLVNQRAERVAMLDAIVPILSATDLMVFTMLFDRRKDWADIEELLRFGKVDVAEARRWLTEVVGSDDPRQQRLDEVLADTRGD